VFLLCRTNSHLPSLYYLTTIYCIQFLRYSYVVCYILIHVIIQLNSLRDVVIQLNSLRDVVIQLNSLRDVVIQLNSLRDVVIQLNSLRYVVIQLNSLRDVVIQLNSLRDVVIQLNSLRDIAHTYIVKLWIKRGFYHVLRYDMTVPNTTYTSTVNRRITSSSV